MINAELFRPKVSGESDKFSWGLYRFLKKYPNSKIMYYRKNSVGRNTKFDPQDSQCLSQLFAFLDGSGLSGAMFGSIMSGRKNSNQLYAFCFWGSENFTDITDWFLKEYARRGRCMFDREHVGWWQGGNDRFTYVNEHSRRCKWCGEWQTRSIEKEVRIKRREVWQ